MHIFNNLDLIILHFVITTEISLIEGSLPKGKEKDHQANQKCKSIVGNQQAVQIALSMFFMVISDMAGARYTGGDPGSATCQQRDLGRSPHLSSVLSCLLSLVLLSQSNVLSTQSFSHV